MRRRIFLLAWLGGFLALIVLTRSVVESVVVAAILAGLSTLVASGISKDESC